MGASGHAPVLAEIATHRTTWAIPWLEGDGWLWHLQPRVAAVSEQVKAAFADMLRGTNLTFRGRGIVDDSRCTTHARNLVSVQGRDITIEGGSCAIPAPGRFPSDSPAGFKSGT